MPRFQRKTARNPINVTFLTGARSEYCLTKPLLSALANDGRFHLQIIPNGMHCLSAFGRTVDEIIADGLPILEIVETYSEKEESKALEFSRSVEKLHAVLRCHRSDFAFVIGDRIEAYAGALAAHFAGIPVVHSGGGHLTDGAVDNIYRFNISNIASLHLATTRGAFERLLRLPLVDSRNVHFVGSVAVDSIHSFLRVPKPLSRFVSSYPKGDFALMTFHPATVAKEPIAEVMQAAINEILEFGCEVLITFPNNDAGNQDILEVIDENRCRPNVFVHAHLSAEGYYAAINQCKFVIGNSSSGLSEAPYFEKPVIDVGMRQHGRDRDKGVKNIGASEVEVVDAIKDLFSRAERPISCGAVYGTGGSVKKVIDCLVAFSAGIDPSRD